MQPRFRTDLTCSREEQQGVVFYRIDDPKTQTSFRLYEIEYLIAQKLDGERELDEVIGAVKQEYNFDISEPDLVKFINQLESMGFIAQADGSDGETGVMPRPEPEGEPEEAEEYIDAALLDTPEPEVDEVELKRLLKSALLHVRQGYIVHARDYFLAAKELSPNDSRLARLVSHLEIIGDSSGPAEVDYLWNQAKELFPEIALEVAPAGDTGLMNTGSIGHDSPYGEEREDSMRSRLLWLFVLAVVVLGVGGALYYFASANRLFEGAAKVSVAILKGERLPLYHEKPAAAVRAAREAWTVIPARGKVAQLGVSLGAMVQPDQVLVSLVMPQALAKKVAATRAAVAKAVERWDASTSKVATLRQQREAAIAERTEAERKLAELAAAGKPPKAELSKWRKSKAKATRKLAELQKSERGPMQQEAKAKQALAKARKSLAEIEKKLTGKQVLAPFAASVVQIAVQKGQAVDKDQRAVLLRDNLLVHLVFEVPRSEAAVTDAEVYVSVAGGAPSKARVAAVQLASDEARLEVALVDPAGSFVDMAPKEFRLVQRFVERAFEVPLSAVAQKADGAHVLIELQGRALARQVSVLHKTATAAILADESGMLRDGDHVIVDRLGGEGGAASIVDGSFVEVQ